MPRVIVLYRGDSMPQDRSRSGSTADRGRTFANLFCGTGIMAKFADGGSSDLLKDRDLLALVLAHVGWDIGTPEEGFTERSPMISFSESEDFALRFANPASVELQPCDFYDTNAGYFTWRLEAPLGNALEPGRYGFEYEFDPVNVQRFTVAAINRGQRRVTEGAAISNVAIPLRDLWSQVSRFAIPSAITLRS